jgi:hypothetical protein
MTRQLLLTAALLSVGSACSDGGLEVFVARDATTAGTGGAGPNIPDPILPQPDGGTGAVMGEGGGAGTPLATEPLLIDDFEDGNTQCIATSGFWYLVNDGTGWQEQITFAAAPEQIPATQALHMRGGGFSQWGTALGLDLAGSYPVFDASGYGELRFHARAEPGSTTDVEVHVLESGLHFSAKVALTTGWSEYVLPLGSMLSTEGDPPRPLDRAAITAIQFFVLSDAAFDYWLDDVVLAP